MHDEPTWSPSWRSSIRFRLVAAVVFVLLVSSLGSVLLVRITLREQLRQEITQSLEREAEEFRLLSTGSDPRTGEPFDGDVQAIFDVYFSREVPDEGESLLAFVGDELVISRRAQDAAAPDEITAAVEFWSGVDDASTGEVDTPLGAAQYVTVPIPGQPEDGLFVVANFPENEQEEIDDAVRVALLAGLAALVVGSLLAFLFAAYVLRPLRLLVETARNIEATDLSRRIPSSQTGEASQVAAVFNSMLGRLERTFETQRRFLDDTSHELRTPLTVIRGHVELLGVSETSREREETTELILDEVDRAADLVSSLSLLARAEQPDFLNAQQRRGVTRERIPALASATPARALA